MARTQLTYTLEQPYLQVWRTRLGGGNIVARVEPGSARYAWLGFVNPDGGSVRFGALFDRDRAHFVDALPTLPPGDLGRFSRDIAVALHETIKQRQ